MDVSPQGLGAGAATPNNGAAFGPDTPGTRTCGLQEAFERVSRAGGGLVRVASGPLQVHAPAVLLPNVTLELDGTTLLPSAQGPAIRIGQRATNTRIGGSFLADGQGRPGPLIGYFGTQQAVFAAGVRVERLAPGSPFLMVNQSRDVHIVGNLTSSDSALVRVADSQGVEVSGVQATYSRPPMAAIVHVMGHSVEDVTLHHLSINGGGVLQHPMVVVAPEQGRQVHLHDIEVVNPPTTTLFKDGVDILHCSEVTVENISGAYVIVTVALLASNATARGVRAHHCRAQSIAVGDPQWMTEDIHDISVEACEAVDCGSGYGGAVASGIAVLNTPGHTVRGVRVRNCLSRDASHLQPYGFGASQGVSDVVVEDCRLSGVHGPTIIQAPPGAVTLSRITAP